jgi:NAD(P)-dependent dehydrogenase (short-subunit alcohol dehydrogenase family)
MSSLTHKNCLVTGGTRGIGRAIAKLLAQHGANVAICGRSPESTAQAVTELHAETGSKVKGKAADVSQYRQVVELFEYLGQELGPLDVLVSNAGVGVFGAVGELSVEQWKAAIETNLYGAFYCVREALPGFETRGGGHIVQIGSIAGVSAFAGGAAYNASKFAIAGFSEAVMQDLRMKNIRVSHVMPGSVATEFGKEAGGGASGADWKIWPEDVAEAVRMLLEMPERTLVSRIELRPSQPKR